MLELRIDGERRVSVVGFEGRGVGRKHIENAIFQGRAPAAVLAWSSPVLVVAAADAGPAVALEQRAQLAALVEIVARAAGRGARSDKGFVRQGRFVERPGRLDEQVALAFRQHGEILKVAPFQHVAGRGAQRKSPPSPRVSMSVMVTSKCSPTRRGR